MPFSVGAVASFVAVAFRVGAKGCDLGKHKSEGVARDLATLHQIYSPGIPSSMWFPSSA
jgi:hypothetical protein